MAPPPPKIETPPPAQKPSVPIAATSAAATGASASSGSTKAAHASANAATNGKFLHVPPVPQTLEETGLSQTLLEGHLLKLIYQRGEMTGRDLALASGLPYSLLEPFIDQFKRQRLIEAKRSLGMGNITTVFALSDAGRALARQALDYCAYSGTAPVPLDQYIAAVNAQRLQGSWLSKAALQKAYSHMVMSEELIRCIGPAVNSFTSFLIYGQPGNGKTYLAEALADLESTEIFMPYAIEANGAIIQVFDPIYHHVADEGDDSALAADQRYDHRWFRCRRPFIVTGGELTLEMLDLSYNESSKIYDAPFQVKANNGIYLIDDFGRQRVTPAEVLNRWIVPMERRVDFLSLRSGGKISIPFECLLVFSTNLRPDQLGDEAFLRRIQYKMLMKSPDPQEFADIFHRICVKKNLTCSAEVFRRFLEKRYFRTSKPFRRCHPRDIINHAIDLINFERLPMTLTDEVLDHAFDSCFVNSEDMV